jgi:hypothetical protein
MGERLVKELVLGLLKFIRDYLWTISRILTSPHNFVLERTGSTEPPRTALRRALLTLAVSLLIALALRAANQPLSWHSVVLSAAVKCLGLMLAAGLLWISWRVVGGRTSGLKFIVAYSYFSAAWLLIFSALMAIDEGAMRLIEPKLFAQINMFDSSGQDTNRLKALVGSQDTYALKALLYSDEGLSNVIRTPGLLWIMSMASLRGAFTFLWLLVSWGAFRKILGTSWFRSILSLAIFLGFGLIAALVVLFFQMAPLDVDPYRWIQRWPLTA